MQLDLNNKEMAAILDYRDYKNSKDKTAKYFGVELSDKELKIVGRIRYHQQDKAYWFITGLSIAIVIATIILDINIRQDSGGVSLCAVGIILVEIFGYASYLGHRKRKFMGKFLKECQDKNVE